MRLDTLLMTLYNRRMIPVLTAASSILFTATVGTLGGIVGAYTIDRLTRSREHEKWLRESRAKEWRELLTALTRIQTVLSLALGLSKLDSRGFDDAKLAEIENLNSDLLVLMGDRIFIALDIGKMGLLRKWTNAYFRYVKDRDGVAFLDEYRGIAASIVAVALHQMRDCNALRRL